MSKEYKQTLNLPETKFPMQANLANTEPPRLARWEQERLYEKVQKDTEGRPVYWLVDGPPYANGDIHIGHAINKTLKDIVVKCARLDGHHAPYVPGWDCHGLPIEQQVEKKFGKVGEKMDAKAFRQKCREYATEQIERQRVDFKRLGILGQWDDPYATMSRGYEAEQLRALATIVEHGHVIRGQKPVYWCLDCHSSLAEAEVEYQDKDSIAIDVRYRAADPGDLSKRFGAKPDGDTSLVIWTTTPWTLPASQAITIHPDFDYSLVQLGDERVVLAKELVEAVARRVGKPAQVLGTVTGEAMKGVVALHPFVDRRVPVCFGAHVTLDAGTGLVHTAPPHGLEDFAVGVEYKLPLDNPVGSDGRYVDGTPRFAGLHVRKADPAIIEVLEHDGALLHKGGIHHSYPHCWRHKTPLIFRATPQWFISMDAKGLRKTALDGIARTRWIPDWGQARIHEMVADRPDWCISRQRYWGVPLAFFSHKQTGQLHPRTAELLRKVADRVEKDGIEAWFDSQASDWLGAEAAGYDKGTDTLDVWFDSGVAHRCSFMTVARNYLSNGEAPVADMYLEGSDQHRGWFQSSLLTSSAMHGRSPFRAVLTHGFTVDEQGRKMSKSLGNVIAPQTVTKTLGADVLRLWVAASDYSGEIAISDNLLKRIADAYRRVRNTMRFLLSNLQDFDPAKDAVAPSDMVALDRWALHAAAQLQDEIARAYRESQFHLVYHKVHNYCVVDLGGLYLDILKDRLYTMPAKSAGRRSAQTAMYHIAEALVRWIAPILSFTADEIWPFLPGDRSGSVFAATWHALPKVMPDAIEWERLRKVRLAVAKVLEEFRTRGEIGAALDAEVTVQAEGQTLKALQAPGDELRFWFITSDARAAAVSTREGVAVDLDGDKVWIAAKPSPHAKCARCWHHRPDVGQNAEHPALCSRCVTNLAAGETRKFV